ncbi:MAG TPA: flagellar motor protein MotB [Chryseobacterium sp.]|nr:flagellar motor protein MotB [Chryseobacterium sp.]
MKKPVVIYALIMSSLILSSCKKSANEQSAAPATDSVAQTPQKETGFDISKIPVSDKDLGDFPFFTVPEGLKVQNKPLQRDFDQVYFPVDGKFVPIEGKSWKTFIVKKDGSSSEFSYPYFEKSYDEAIKEAGGVKIFDGKVSKEELDQLKEKAKYLGEEGSQDYWNEPVKVYVIRRAAGDDIYIQFSGNNASGAIEMVQKSPFKQTISKVQSEQIRKDLNEKGKSVLHINFDTDKATLKPDGKEAVAEIVKVLDQDKTLKLDINGYTDQSGNSSHNQQLSKDRADTVLNTIAQAGIDKNRLSAHGYGDSSPIASNDDGAGKAQNRRVELVKR